MRKPVKISILSDLHFDSHLPSFGVTETMVRRLFDPIFKTPADVLVIAGDLGHYNNQTFTIVKMLREIYFKHIVCVLGNHDYYLVNRMLIDDYDNNSFKRVEAMRNLLNSIDGVYCLDGNIVEIEGIRFGGCDSWYDGQYWLVNLNPHYVKAMFHVREQWRFTMNDYPCIKGIKQFDDLWEIEKPKIEAVYKKCDVMITHVMPSINPEHVDRHYQSDKGTAYFCFDGEKYLKETTAHTWIYGHSHTNQEVDVHGVRMIANQMGYRGEARQSPIEEKVIEIWPEPEVVSPKTIGEALKSAEISPKNRFNRYAVDAIAKTTPCLRDWQPKEKKQ